MIAPGAVGVAKLLRHLVVAPAAALEILEMPGADSATPQGFRCGKERPAANASRGLDLDQLSQARLP